MLKIGFLPTSFEVNRNEASNISLKLLSIELAKNNKIYIFTGNIRNKSLIETFKKVKIIRFSHIYGFKHKYRLLANLRAFWTHLFASVNSYKKSNQGVVLDIIHGFSSSHLLSLRTLAFKKFNKNGVYIHTIKGNSSFKEFNFISKILINKLDAIIVLNNLTKNKLISIGIKKEKVYVIRSPVNLDKFKPAKNISILKKRYKYQNKKIILYYGHFNKFKGVEYLIKSLKFIKTKNILLLLIPSDNSQKNFYDEIIKKEKVADKIKILNAKVNIVDFVNLTDVTCFPYPDLISTEANPSCVIESLACKTPVVTSDLLELKEFLKHKENVLLAKPKNTKSIAKNIDDMFNNQKLREKIIKKGFQISKYFDYKKITKQHLKIYKYLIKNN